MTEPDDPFDTWLDGQVEPLRPPPGTFSQIRKRARRRKMRRAVVSAASAGAAAAVIVVAVVAVPKLVPSLHATPKPAANSTVNRPTFGASQHPTVPVTKAPMSSAATSTGAPPAEATGFAPSSVTFITLNTGYVLGQAKCGTASCMSMAETTNAGQTWASVPAPQTGWPDGSTGVNQVRFIDPDHGWAFGPQLYQTVNGGQSWQLVNTFGLRVTSLEAVGGMAYAVFAKCSGAGDQYGVNCTHVSLYSAPVGSETWTPMTSLQGLGFNQGDVSGKIVLTHGEGYFYAPDGLLYGGPTSPGAAWAQLGSAALPCLPSGGSADGNPTGGQLAASSAGHLALACPDPSGGDQESIYTSIDNGLSWQTLSVVPVTGAPTSLAAGTSGVLTLSTTTGIYTSPDGGAHWSLALHVALGGFNYVGLTSPTQGVAVPTAPGQYNSVWFTFDGGKRWHQSSIKNP